MREFLSTRIYVLAKSRVSGDPDLILSVVYYPKQKPSATQIIIKS